MMETAANPTTAELLRQEKAATLFRSAAGAFDPYLQECLVFISHGRWRRYPEAVSLYFEILEREKPFHLKQFYRRVYEVWKAAGILGG